MSSRRSLLASRSPLTSLHVQLNNCGSKGNVCQSSWSYGTGRQCLAGVCQPASCNSGYDFNFSTNKCQNVQSDTSNWYASL